MIDRQIASITHHQVSGDPGTGFGGGVGGLLPHSGALLFEFKM